MKIFHKHTIFANSRVFLLMLSFSVKTPLGQDVIIPDYKVGRTNRTTENLKSYVPLPVMQNCDSMDIYFTSCEAHCLAHTFYLSYVIR